jgi:uncharacterized C2H2 Zn-finger protein
VPLDEEIEQRRKAKQGAISSSGAFGKVVNENAFTDRILDAQGDAMPVITQAEIKRHPLSTAWLLPAIRDPKAEPFIGFESEGAGRWVFGDTADGAFEVKAFGSGFATEDEARTFVIEQNLDRVAHYQQHLYEDYLAHQGPVSREQAMKVYQCPECGQTFDTLGKLSGHKNFRHGEGGVCPECGKEFDSKPGLGAHRAKSHGYRNPEREGRRERRAARAAVSADVTPDSVPPAQPGTDVLADHLLTVPVGADAEDQVARVRAIVAAPLVEEVRRLRSDNAQLRAEVELLTKEKDETEAKMSILREALTL